MVLFQSRLVSIGVGELLEVGGESGQRDLRLPQGSACHDEGARCQPGPRLP